MEALEQEPSLLRNELAALDAELQQVSAANRGVFLQQCRCGEAVLRNRRDMASSAADVDAALMHVAELTAQFSKQGGALFETHKRNRRAQRQHVHLLELLEIPQLMSTCVRNDLHELAVQIAAFSVDLGRQEGGDGAAGARGAAAARVRKVLACIAAEIDASATLLRDRLAARLREPLELAQFLAVVGTLRRLAALHPARLGVGDGDAPRRRAVLDALEAELEQLFLSGRDECYAAAPAAAGRPATFSQAVEDCRIRFFEVATQFDALFCVDDAAAEGAARVGRRDRAALLLAAWLARHATEFRRDVERWLGTVEAAALPAAVQTVMFFGASLARNGGELRPMLVDPLEAKVRSLTRTKWDAVVDAQLAQEAGAAAEPAAALDALLASLNDLRVCAPLAMETELTAALDAARERARDAATAKKRALAAKQHREGADSEQVEALRLEVAQLEAAHEVIAHAASCLADVYAGGSSRP
ncbi:Dor1-like family-domain-containing protein [Pelagophyceae sp. CCMP2097]|nr:Dor1-like family-domain-containing protein [Pelagophyceae sp. CCMP2097]